jgi:G:T-mismatch repair DNA endonuclease (very short patch repair protein)
VRIRAQLRQQKWQVLVIWECQTTGHHLAELSPRISKFLEALPSR